MPGGRWRRGESVERKNTAAWFVVFKRRWCEAEDLSGRYRSVSTLYVWQGTKRCQLKIANSSCGQDNDFCMLSTKYRIDVNIVWYVPRPLNIASSEAIPQTVLKNGDLCITKYWVIQLKKFCTKWYHRQKVHISTPIPLDLGHFCKHINSQIKMYLKRIMRSYFSPMGPCNSKNFISSCVKIWTNLETTLTRHNFPNLCELAF